jgi:hypothetical protein
MCLLGPLCAPVKSHSTGLAHGWPKTGVGHHGLAWHGLLVGDNPRGYKWSDRLGEP